MYHWLQNIKELSILNVRYLTISKLKSEEKSTLQDYLEKEYSADGVFEKILYLIVTLYFVATEMRLMEEQTKNSEINPLFKMLESEIWLGKSLEISYLFLPHSTPLVGQMIHVYKILYAMQQVPKDQYDQRNHYYSYVALNPLKGARPSNLKIPILRYPKHTGAPSRGVLGGQDVLQELRRGLLRQEKDLSAI